MKSVADGTQACREFPPSLTGVTPPCICSPPAKVVPPHSHFQRVSYVPAVGVLSFYQPASSMEYFNANRSNLFRTARYALLNHLDIKILPTPEKIRERGADKDAILTEFQQELLQLGAVLTGEDILATYPQQIGKHMTVKQGKKYMDDAVKSFFEAGIAARRMGVDEDQIVKRR